VQRDGLRYTFYLRGHPEPRGTRLPNTSDLPMEWSRGRSAPPDRVAARWSDGVAITAHDFVYSWRRVVDPRTGAELAYLMQPLRNAQKISAGQFVPNRLRVRAVDEYSLEADLEYPTPYLPELVSGRAFSAVPRHVIEAAGAYWIDPERIFSSGAFRLTAHRPYDSIVWRRNPRYYEVDQVALEQFTVLVSRDLTSLVNEYRAGVAMLAHPSVPTIMPVLRQKKDFRPQPRYSSGFFNINTRTPPFDDVRVRYALNMATDKRPVAKLFGRGWIPATGLVPSSATYEPPRTLPVSIGGRACDVLSFNPEAARALLSGVGTRLPERIEYVIPNSPDDALWAQVLKQQWRANLGVEVKIRAVEFQTWIDTFHHGTFRHLADAGSPGGYTDPTWFLDLFSRPDGYGTHWVDPQYQGMLTHAKATADPGLRSALLAECERRLLESMPILPLAYWVDAQLRKPFVRVLGDNLLDRQQFKYVWIDTNWRPS
jgi:ABC-type oligopeptide transport system substrate-binding subunit